MKNSSPPFAYISIPKPCREDWTGMELTEEGRFCKQCSKSVIDFSHFSDQQLHDYIEKHRKSSICGKIPLSKLNKPFILSPPKKQFSGWWLLSALVGISLPVYAQTNQHIIEQTEPQQIPTTHSIEKSDTNFICVKGSVSDATTGERLPFAPIQLLPLSIHAYSNVDGEFELKIPDSTSHLARYELVLTDIGFETIHKQFSYEELFALSSSPLLLELKMAQVGMIGEVIYVRAPWHKRLKYRIKRMFKRTQHESSST
jgi:hypothetical protein